MGVGALSVTTSKGGDTSGRRAEEKIIWSDAGVLMAASTLAMRRVLLVGAGGARNGLADLLAGGERWMTWP